MKSLWKICLFAYYFLNLHHKEAKMQYEVTIGIPVYRAVDYIKKTMESALCQTFSSIEFLVLNDCGEDGSMAIVEQFQTSHPRGKDIRIIHHSHNCGVGISRNRILDEAKGRYLYFLDSDDLIEPNTIELMVKAALQSDAQVVYGSWEKVDNVDHSPTQQHPYPSLEFVESDMLATYAFKNYSSFWISVCNCLMDTSFLKATHLRFLDTVFWEDLAFTYELVTKVTRAVLLPEITYHYLCRPGSLSHYQDRDELQKDEILRNVSTIDHLKRMCRSLRGRSFLPYLCYNLEVSSFYIVCYVLKHSKRIYPSVSNKELLLFMKFPLPLREVAYFRGKWIENLLLYVMSKMPAGLFVGLVKAIGKVKRVI